MPDVRSQGVRIHYEVAGDGPPLVLVHGWTASVRTNWELPGWIDFLAPRYRLILPDLRGHGRSAKPHRKASYSLPAFAADVLAVMDHAGVQQARVMGYSMGGMVTLELLAYHPERFSAAIVGGMGAQFPRERRVTCEDEEDAHDDPPDVPRNLGRRLKGAALYFRHYDVIAQNAIWRGVFKGKAPVRDLDRLRDIRQPVLIVVGARDPLCPGTRLLADYLPNARRLTLSGRNHLSAVPDPRYKAAAAEFFASHG